MSRGDSVNFNSASYYAPVLLDTCVVQHLTWVYERRASEQEWTQEDSAKLTQRYGRLADELLALWELVDRYEMASSSPTWLVSNSSLAELQRAPVDRREANLSTWRWVNDSTEGMLPDGYATIAPGLLVGADYRPNILVLGGLGIASADQLLESDGPLTAFPDHGDRVLIGEALFAGVQTLMTTDLRTIWRHRDAAAALGLAIVRPQDLLGSVFAN